jgi:hypothetical protein
MLRRAFSAVIATATLLSGWGCASIQSAPSGPVSFSLTVTNDLISSAQVRFGAVDETPQLLGIVPSSEVRTFIQTTTIGARQFRIIAETTDGDVVSRPFRIPPDQDIVWNTRGNVVRTVRRP